MTTLTAPGARARDAAGPTLDRPGGAAKPLLDGRRPPGESALVYFFTLGASS
jgi:stearoyl-CoA desaturase (Delta-9 desaturase)